MSENLRVFLAHSFAPQNVNSNGEEDANGISDRRLADFVEFDPPASVLARFKASWKIPKSDLSVSA